MNYSFLRWPNFKKKAVTLSYDDGVIYDKKLLEIMEKNGLKGTFNINSGYFAGNRRLTVDECKELYASPNAEVAVHGVLHRSLASISVPEMVNDVINDRKNLESVFQTRVQGMAYANGSFNDDAVNVLKTCGINYARTIISTEKFDIPTDWLRLPATCHHNNPRLMELAREFVEDKPARHFWFDTPKLFYLWGHSYEFNDKDNWHVIEEFAEFMGNREDVWYATNGEIYDYVNAFHQLVFGLNEDYIYNPTATDVYVVYLGKPFVVPSGQTIRVK